MNEALCNYECCFQCGIPVTSPEMIGQQCKLCLEDTPYFDETYCLGFYNGKLQNALHQLKYQKRLSYAHGLTCIWNDVMPEHLNALQADYLLPVPLSAEKLWLRGFNQSWELARRIQCKDSIHKMPYILKRRHHEKPQAGSSLSIRQSNIRGAFYLEKDALALLKNKSVIVFDDVMTSGATLDEIARILKDNGVSRVTNWVLLRTSKTSVR